MLSWLHIGDLHAADEDDWASIDALRAIAAEARELGDEISFIFLPGDIANHGEAEQYARVRGASPPRRSGGSPFRAIMTSSRARSTPSTPAWRTSSDRRS